MHICLIIPPSAFLLDERVFPFLGILKVSASLEQAGHKVDVLDLSGVTNYEEVVRFYVFTHQDTGVYGITATSPQMPAAVRIAKNIPDSAVRMLGGPHVTLTYAAKRLGLRHKEWNRAADHFEYLKDTFEVLVCGDGEKAVHAAINNYSPVVDADDPGSDLFLTHQTFTESPWPDRSKLDMGSYHYYIEGERATSIISQLGCPFRCAFCAGRNSASLRRIRLRPPEDVVDEISSLYEQYGYKGFMFLDDELNVNTSMLDLMQLLAVRSKYYGVEWKLRGFLKAELFTEEQAIAMRDAGFRQLLIGFEAGDPRILRNIQKVATLEDNTRAMNIAHKYDLKVKALMSIGHPGESVQTIRAVRQWLLQVKPADFDVTVITPYPGSPYYDEATLVVGRAYGVEPTYKYTCPHSSGGGYHDSLYMDDVDFTTDALYYKGAPGSYKSHVWTPYISPDLLVEMRDWVEADVRDKLKIPFYSSGTSMQYEHSMAGGLPNYILKVS